MSRSRPLGCLLLLAATALLGLTIVLLTPPLVGLGAALVREVEPHTAGPGRFVEADGLQLHVQQWGPEDGPPLLLVGGTSAWGQTWVEVAEPLAAKGYRVLTVDLPPFGYSERPTDDAYTRADQARRILATAEAVQLTDYTLVGHSFGGGPTVEAAALDNGRIARLVLLDVALGLEQPPAPVTPLLRIPLVSQPLVSLTLANPLMVPPGMRTMVHRPSTVTPERAARYQQPLHVRGTTAAMAAWLPELAGPTPAVTSDPAALTDISIETLILWGDQDTATPLDQGQRIHELLPHSTLTVLPDVGHLPQIEDPQAVVAAIQGFVR